MEYIVRYDVRMSRVTGSVEGSEDFERLYNNADQTHSYKTTKGPVIAVAWWYWEAYVLVEAEDKELAEKLAEDWFKEGE
jgi:hypothetical protein